MTKKEEKGKRKLEKKREKAKKKRYKKIRNGLDICMIFVCFVICLISAVFRMLDIRKSGGR